MTTTSFFTKTLGQSLADASHICQITATGESGKIGLTLSVVQGAGINRVFKVSVPSNATGSGVWKRLVPYDTPEKIPNYNNWGVDIRSVNNVVTLRLVRTKVGTTPSTTSLACKVVAYAHVGDSVAIADDVTTAVEVTNDGTYEGTLVTPLEGKLAINGDYPTDALDVTGNVNATSTFRINGTKVLDATSLGAGVQSSNLTSVGTLTGLTVASGNVFLPSLAQVSTGNVLFLNASTGQLTYSTLDVQALSGNGNLSLSSLNAATIGVTGNVTAGNLSTNAISATAISTSTLIVSGNTIDSLLALKVDSANVYTKTQLDAGQLNSLYYTETEVNTLLNAKENVITASTTATYFRGDKTFQTLNTTAVPEAGSNLYFSNARAQAAVVTQTITDGVTTTAPSENAVFDALALKADSANVYTKTQLDAGQLNSLYYTETEIDTLLNAKENVITASTTATYFRGDKTFQTLNTSAVPESGSNLYFSNARAQTAVVSQTISDGVTTTAPSENAVFDALALKADSANVYTKSQLDAGQLDTRYYTETEVNNLLAGKANVANPSITGTLVVTGNATFGNVSTNAISATAITASTVQGTLTTASQPAITTVGELSSLQVAGLAAVGSLTSNAITATMISGTSLNASGNVTANNVSANSIAGIIITSSQPLITSLGTLTSANVSGALSVGGNVTAGNVSTNVISATAMTSSSLAVSANASAGNLAVSGKFSVNGSEWASSVVYGTNAAFTYYGPGATYANGISFFAQTESNGTSFVTPSGTGNSVFTFTAAGTYMLQAEIETGFPWWPEGDVTSFFIKNLDASKKYGAESHFPENFSATRPYLLTVGANDNVRFVVDSSTGNDFEAGIGSCRLTMLKIA